MIGGSANMKKHSRIYVADHEGFFGRAIAERLVRDGHKNLLLASRTRLDLLDQDGVRRFFRRTKPEYVFLAAQKSGGILANIKYPADFIYENLMIQTNVIHASLASGVRKLLFFGASCIYPKDTPQPIKESYFLRGDLEKTSEAYAIAKIAGIGMCEAYTAQHDFACIPVVPATVYGPGSSFDLENAHVLQAMIRKFHEAKLKKLKEVVIWGTGKPRREFLYVDDLADVCIFLMKHYNNPKLINVGFGEDVSIKKLAQLVRAAVGFTGGIRFDRSKPDGVFRKILDNTKIRGLGWKPKIGLEEGIRKTYAWYVAHSS